MSHRNIYENESSGYDTGNMKRKSYSLVAIVSFFLIVMGSIILYSSTIKDSKSYNKKSLAIVKGATSSSEILFTLGRVGYKTIPYFNNQVKTQPKYNFLEKFMAVIEPHASMELRIYNEESSKLTSTYKYIYEVCPLNSENSECQKSTKSKSSSGDVLSGEIKFECAPFETFDINIYKMDEDSKEITSHTTGKAICVYVRREIRSLSESDLQKFVETSHTLWEVNQEDGQAKYGDKYHSAGYLLKLHHFNAAQIDADHIHEGTGFLLQHNKITNIFETSLKAVDPSVYLPYWDYTIDDAGRHSVIDSVIMTEKIYGMMFMPVNIEKGFSYANDKIADGKIIGSLWADLKADMNEDFPSLKAGYGYMRAPWSMNPSPYISRFTTVFDRTIMLPSCQMHYDSLVDYDTMMDFFFQVAYFPHATVHTLAGGVYGCDKLLPLFEKGYINSEEGVSNICKNWVFTLKEFYRHNLITPRKNCEVNTDNLEQSQCGFDCVPEHKSIFEKALLLAVKKDANVKLDDAAQVWSDFLCDGGPGGHIFPGDHLESASPTDPSFWVVHPTIERLFQYKLLTGGFADESWYTDISNNNSNNNNNNDVRYTDPVNQKICEKPSCYNSTHGFTSYWPHCCYGHYENDQMLDFESGDINRHVGPSNKEFLAMGDPRTAGYQLPYIYDEFTWSHCEENDFAGLMEGKITTESNYKKTDTANPGAGKEPDTPVGYESGKDPMKKSNGH